MLSNAKQPDDETEGFLSEPNGALDANDGIACVVIGWLGVKCRETPCFVTLPERSSRWSGKQGMIPEVANNCARGLQ